VPTGGDAAALQRLVRRRRMVRSFADRPVGPPVLERLLDAARRGPSAGHAQGTDLLVLQDDDARTRFWALALPEERRTGFAFPGLLRAPVLVVPLADEAAYRARYAEPDKVGSGLAALGADEPWPVPYWLTDTAMATMLLLLAAEAEDLGALFYAFPGDPSEVLAGFGVPDDRVPLGVVALGHPDGEDPPGRSAARARRAAQDVVHHDRW
jgi:nitroreductase